MKLLIEKPEGSVDRIVKWTSLRGVADEDFWEWLMRIFGSG